jgi:Flp pilus assembly protein TadB
MMTILALALGATLATGVVMGVLAWNGSMLTAVVSDRFSARIRTLGPRAWKAAGVTVAVAVVTRWPVAALASGALTWLWPDLFGGAPQSRIQLARLEAIATWTESLRDTMAAAIGLEQAIASSVDAAQESISPQLRRLAGRLRAHVPLQHALASFAEEFDDASVDLVVAALIMNARLRGAGLIGTLTALAATARDELEMRMRVEESRKNLRRSANIIVAVTALFAGGMMVLSRNYLSPYGSFAGQLMLLVVVSGFLAGFIWIRNASRTEPAPRFLVSAAQLASAAGGAS